MPTTSVDLALMHAAADRIDAAADLLQDVVDTQLRALRFDGTAAGRAHRADGDAVCAAVRGTVAGTARWTRAARDLACALRAGAQAHAGAEQQAAGTMR
jgi:hypothetical protein